MHKVSNSGLGTGKWANRSVFIELKEQQLKLLEKNETTNQEKTDFFFFQAQRLIHAWNWGFISLYNLRLVCQKVRVVLQLYQLV